MEKSQHTGFIKFHGQQSKQMSGFLTKLDCWSKEGTVRHCQTKEASILCTHHEETMELPGKRDNARDNAGRTQATKTTHGLGGTTSIRRQDFLWKNQSD